MEVLIVGSGPAGVSAAWPLVRAGIRVLMLDASLPLPLAGEGRGEDGSQKGEFSACDSHPHPTLSRQRERAFEALLPPPGPIGAFRRAPGRWRAQFGATLAGLVSGADLSPKLSTPLAQAALRGYAEASGLTTERFHAFGSLASGGLSQIWGAMTPRFEAAELADFPITLEDLAPSYAAIAERIGLSSPGIDGPALTGAVQRLFRRLPARSPTRIEPAMNAVSMTDRNGRLGCAECGMCLFGCERKSIYSSADELPELLRHPHFTYRPGTLVRRIERAGTEWRVAGELAPRIVLAAGTIATTALAARLLGVFDTEIRLLTNPVAACAFLVPALIGAALPERSFSLAQLRHETPLAAGGTVGGAIYGADTLPLHELARRIPASRPTALRLARALAPALAFATLYAPGRDSRNAIRVGEDTIAITGEVTAAARAALAEGRGQLARTLRRAGAYAVPGSFTVSGAGADAHYAGTIPMGGDAPLACSRDGELRGASGVYVADGAALSALPSKHCTLTIMANADRIGRTLAATIRPSSR